MINRNDDESEVELSSRYGCVRATAAPSSRRSSAHGRASKEPAPFSNSPSRARRIAVRRRLRPEDLTMPAHKFAAGQMVRFTPDRSEAVAVGRGGSFKIVPLLLEAAGVPLLSPSSVDFTITTAGCSFRQAHVAQHRQRIFDLERLDRQVRGV